ncbi:hypothetical protein HQ533_00065 [Candidatus Woesearchaeota archaeon]|nr:hypothetical protein [Candidatus Woesearchaeota archaeon]
MKIIHKLGHQAQKKEGEGCFLLTDKTGGFLSLGSKENITHMQGLFHLDKNWNSYKSIENIYLDKNITELENHFYKVIRRYGTSQESFHLTATALIYEVKSYVGNINIDFDFREMFNFDDKDRHYSIDKKKGMLIIHYKKHKKYLAIKGIHDFEVVDQWEKKDYSYDKIRNTKSDFYIYKAVKIRCNGSLKLFISFGESEKEAMNDAESASLNEKILKEALRLKTKNLCRRKKLSANAAINSLDSLRTIVGKGANKMEGVFAGLPWFYQFWGRDELISLKAFMIEERFDFVKKRLMAYLEAIDDNGRIPNRLPKSNLDSADGIGWLFKRLHDFLSILEEKKCLKGYFSKDDLMKIKHKLHFCIEEHMVKYMEDYIMYTELNETWMDTDVNGKDGRPGACIEIQTLFLSFFKLMKILCKHLNLIYYGYRSLEKVFAKHVKKAFFKQGNLLDRLGDNTIRPNVFIAYYVYPELLWKHEWKMVFNKALRALWHEWGGLTSIDKKNKLYKSHYTGDENSSYHRGDSWYWINNMAAICMNDLDRKKYYHFIERIFYASKKELMFSGFIGHAAEVSSAAEQKSEGCLAQAWSAATYIELADKLKQL